MRIGELAEACAVRRNTLHFSKQRGLIASQRSANGYRDHAPERVQRVLSIKTAQRLGFSLGEIGSRVAAQWQAAAPDQAASQRLPDKLTPLETRISKLGLLRQELQQRLGQACPLNP